MNNNLLIPDRVVHLIGTIPEDAETRHYIVPYEPISLNSMYSTNRGGHRFLVNHARVYKEFIKECLEFGDYGKGGPPIWDFYTVTMIFLFPAMVLKGRGPAVFFQNENLQPKDVTNYFKAVEDSLADYLGRDDRHNIDIHGYKRIALDGKSRIVIYVSPQRLDKPIYHNNQIVEF